MQLFSGNALFLNYATLMRHVSEFRELRNMACPSCTNVNVLIARPIGKFNRIKDVQEAEIPWTTLDPTKFIVKQCFIITQSAAQETIAWGFHSVPQKSQIQRKECSLQCLFCKIHAHARWLKPADPTCASPKVALSPITINPNMDVSPDHKHNSPTLNNDPLSPVISSPRPIPSLPSPPPLPFRWLECLQSLFHIPLYFHWPSEPEGMSPSPVFRKLFGEMTERNVMSIVNQLTHHAEKRLTWLRDVLHIFEDATLRDNLDAWKTLVGKYHREFNGPEFTPQHSPSPYDPTLQPSNLIETLRQEYLKHDSDSTRYKEMKLLLYLSEEETHFVRSILFYHQKCRSSFMIMWWLACTMNLSEFESWIELERRVRKHFLESKTFSPFPEGSIWFEEKWLSHSSSIVIHATQWRGISGRLRFRKSDSKAIELRIRGLVPHEKWFQSKANGAGTIHFYGQSLVASRASDLFVRFYKSRTLAWRNLLSTCPGMTRILQLASGQLKNSEAWKSNMLHITLAETIGLPAVQLPVKNQHGPKPWTEITQIPTSCPDPTARSLSELIKRHKLWKGQSETLGYNATNMTDGGCALFPTTNEFLLSRAYLAMTCETEENVWQQCKGFGKDATFSRFSIELEVNSSESGLWLDPIMQYMPVLREYRVWEPTGVRGDAFELSNKLCTTSFALILHHAVRDALEGQQTKEGVIVSACGMKKGLPRSSFVFIFPDVEPLNGQDQKNLFAFCQKRQTEIFGRIFSGQKTEDLLDKQPYWSSFSGGGSRFLYDDKCDEIICDSCSGEMKRKNVHALYCPTKTCQRNMVGRIKIPFAMMNANNGRLLAQTEWGTFVLHSSVWATGTEPSKLYVQKMDGEPGSVRSLIWTRHKKLDTCLSAKIKYPDKRWIRITEFLQKHVWNSTDATLGKLEVVQYVGHSTPSYYTAFMKKGSVWCLNYKNKHIHSRLTFVRFMRKNGGACYVNDFACIKEREDKLKKEKMSNGKGGGISQMIIIPHGNKQNKPSVAAKHMHEDNPYFADRIFDLYADPELYRILFPFSPK